MDDNVTDSINNIKENHVYRLIIFALVLITLIVFYNLLLKKFVKNRYEILEEKMVEVANDYVLNNNIYTDSEIYLDVTLLDLSIDNDCYLTSGVLYNGNDFTPNLMCDNYKSKVIKNNDLIKDFITLNGDDVVVLPKGIDYFESGYNSKDIVNTIGNVGVNDGVYDIYYKTINSNSVAIRKVIIIDNEKIRSLYPSISLNGKKIIYLKQGETYNELGASSNDLIDGDISDKIIITGNVNSKVSGEYIVNYLITNSRGYKNSVSRIVKVINQDDNLNIDYTISPNTLTNDSVKINLVTSDNISKIIYPNNQEGTDLEYIVKDNGHYEFIIYDLSNHIYKKEIEITNIDKSTPEGSCRAISYYNRTEIKVTMDSERMISQYDYTINGINIGKSKSNTLISNITNPSLVKVTVSDSINNQNDFICSIEENTSRKIVTDANGKNCLEGLSCYVQFNYNDGKRYPYCAINNMPSSCGGIGRSGSSITAVANVLSMMNIKSNSGIIHTPYTVWDELYSINKESGTCNGGCASWTKIREAIVKTGLTAPKKISYLSTNSIDMIIEHLKKGYPVIVQASERPFASDKINYLTLIGINELNQIFISDSTNKNGTIKDKVDGKQYYVDTWISKDDLITGNIKEFLLIGPPGMFEGK